MNGGSAAPVAVSYQSRNTRPVFRPGRDHTVVEHTEFLGTITNETTGFEICYDKRLNPGLEDTFPWLHKTAENWEFYSVDRAEVQLVSRTPTSVPGSVALFVDYDSKDKDPTSMEEFMNNYGAISSSVWDGPTMKLEYEGMHPIGNFKFIRHEADSGDARLYDVGRLRIAFDGVTQGAEAAVIEIYVKYKVKLYLPQRQTEPKFKLLWDGQLENNVDIVSAATVPIGGSVVPLDVRTDKSEVDISIDTSGNITAPEGKYLFETIVNMGVVSSGLYAFRALLNGVVIREEQKQLIGGDHDTMYVWLPVVLKATDSLKFVVDMIGAGTIQALGTYMTATLET
jgi:hypothetical protein